MVHLTEVLEVLKVNEDFLRQYLSHTNNTGNPIKGKNALELLVPLRYAIEKELERQEINRRTMEAMRVAAGE